ncbi:MAG: Bax inhibitor-1/YccA family protein [Kineosporiaceae bacterium]
MESRNPVFNRNEGFNRGGYATFNTPTPSAGALEDMYRAPSATPVDTGRMTLDDVVMRTAALFGVLLLTAAPTYFFWKPGFLVIIGAGLVAMVVGFVAQMGKTVRPPLMFAYAALEGVFVGGLSWLYAARWDGIVPQAVFGTLAAFTAMLVLYKTGVIRNSPKFTKILMIAVVGYIIFGLVNLMFALFAGVSIYSGNPLIALAVSAFGVTLASLFLVLDFDFIEQGIKNGIPEQYAWLAAFGLMVTLVWLYVEMLRLISILRGDN